jgi:hypothetical protein
MIVGALMFVEVTAGITEASMTRRPPTIAHAKAAGLILGSAGRSRLVSRSMMIQEPKGG